MTYEEHLGDYRFSLVKSDLLFPKLICGDEPGEWTIAAEVREWLVENAIRYRIFIGQRRAVPYGDFVFQTKDEAMRFKVAWG